MRIGRHTIDGFSAGVGAAVVSVLLCIPAVSEPLVNLFGSIRDKIGANKK